MRILWIAAMLVLAGCMEDEASPVDEEPVQEAEPVELPANLRHEGSMPAVFTPAGVFYCVDECSVDYHFTIPNATVATTLKLVSVQAMVSDPTGLSGVETDYDLNLLDAKGKVLGESYEYGYDPDIIERNLGPGDYVARVFTFQDADGGYVLDITFAWP